MSLFTLKNINKVEIDDGSGTVVGVCGIAGGVSVEGNLKVGGTGEYTGTLTIDSVNTGPVISAGSYNDASGPVTFNSGTTQIGSGSVSSTTITGTNNGVFGTTLTVATGSITDTSGAISFGNENLSTTGGVSAQGGMSAGSLVLSSGSIIETSGNLAFSTTGGPGTTVTLGSATDTINFNGAYSFPTSDGTTGFVLQTDGAGTLTFEPPGGGGGGATDINGLTDAFADATNVVLGVSPQSISGSDNVGVGVSALNAITTGSRNIALGFDALITGTTVNDNIAIGDHSLRAATTISSQNVGIGTSTLAKITSGTSQNVAVGYIAGQEITSGYQNTIVGASAGITLTTGQNNVILGYGAEPASASSNNNVYLGNTSMSNLYFSGNIIATSDSRDKTDVVDSTYGVEFIEKLRPVEYTWNRRHLQPGDDNDNINGKRRVGLIAQELLEIMPDNENEVLNLVNEDNPERYHVGYNNLIPILVKSVKDLKAEVDTLKQRMDNCSC